MHRQKEKQKKNHKTEKNNSSTVQRVQRVLLYMLANYKIFIMVKVLKEMSL